MGGGVLIQCEGCPEKRRRRQAARGDQEGRAEAASSSPGEGGAS